MNITNESILGQAMQRLGMKVEEDKPTMYMLRDKLYLTEEQAQDYISEHIDEFRDTYTNDQIEDIIDEVFSSEVEEVEIDLESEE